MNELIERYIYAVTRSLPKSQRADVEQELRGEIHDMIAAEKGPEKTRVTRVLEALGRPEKLAMDYAGTKQYLIGPEWFSVYVETLKKIGMVAIPVLLLIFTATNFSSPDPLIEKIIAIVISTIGAATNVAFWTTAVFVFLERTNSHATEKNEVLAWSVDQLPQLPPERHVPVSDAVANIVFYAALIVLVLLSRNTLGITDNGTFVSFFEPSLWSFWLWAILATLVGLIGKELYVLKNGRETAASIWAKIGLDGALTAMLVGLYLQHTLVNPAFAEKTNQLVTWYNSFEWTIGAFLALWAIGFVWSAAKLLWDHYRKSAQ